MNTAPRYYRYTKHAACHWLVNFNLKLTTLVDPQRAWRILASEKHSTVWDSLETLFECNLLAFGAQAQECFDLAFLGGQVLLPGKFIRTYYAQHYSKEP
jgi:hypothetical protein